MIKELLRLQRQSFSEGFVWGVITVTLLFCFIRAFSQVIPFDIM